MATLISHLPSDLAFVRPLPAAFGCVRARGLKTGQFSPGSLGFRLGRKPAEMGSLSPDRELKFQNSSGNYWSLNRGIESFGYSYRSATIGSTFVARRAGM
jgi:hypothetical protein